MTRAEKITKKKERLKLYYVAEEAILGGAQSYSMGTRSLTRANLVDIKNTIDKLEDEIKQLEDMENGKRPRRAFSVVPRDF